MNLREEQEELYKRHKKEEGDFFAKAVKELAKHELDVLGGGYESYNDDGGVDSYKDFCLVRKDLRNKDFNEKEEEDFKKFLVDNGLDFDLEDMFSYYVECGFEKSTCYRFVTKESGEVENYNMSNEDEEICRNFLDV